MMQLSMLTVTSKYAIDISRTRAVTINRFKTPESIH